ncbi:MAG: hypothetical protein HRT36_06675 [Alphaproteobacteria bacterium]|nr:hypothetical protein [Alphaproteobacteria bacterium]
MLILRFLKRWLIPSSLMARLQVLVVVPILVIISLNAYIFFERHWYEVQLVLVRSVVRELAHVINYLAPPSMEWRELVGDSLDLDIAFYPGQTLHEPRRISNSTTDRLIAEQMQQWVGRDFDVDTQQPGKRVYFWVQLPDGVAAVELHRKRVESFTIRLMIGFVLFSAILFSVIAALFMRKQVQPLVALTRHIQQNRPLIPKGRGAGAVPTFGYTGASEVRELTRAFIEFQHRQLAALRERSEMLHGISHDLRTPLTRMKLQLAMLEQTPEVMAMNNDIDLMSRMLESYLEFVAQNSKEEPESMLVTKVLSALAERWQHCAERITLPDAAVLQNFAASEVKIFIRPQLLTRALDNLLENAIRYANHVWLEVYLQDQMVLLSFCDDGPGVPAGERQLALTPFHRLDSARRSETGGTGLGLALVKETMILHEGGIILDDAPQGGLRVVLSLPVVA